MAQLVRYQEFTEKVDELGFMFFSKTLEGLPAFPDYTIESNWFTEDPDIDPWLWKYRAPQEKRLAFGNVLGGQKGFVAPRLYQVFYTAYHPQESIEERWAAGEVSQTKRRLWQLFEEDNLLNTSEMRHEMGVTLSRGGSRLDSAIKDLQREYYITVAGSRLKLDKQGKPYGWYENIYSKVRDWAPEKWMKSNHGLKPEEAREMILDAGVKAFRGIDRARLARVLRIDSSAKR
jgi:hypothetical protein